MYIKNTVRCIVVISIGYFILNKVRNVYYKKMSNILTDLKMMKVILNEDICAAAFYTGLCLGKIEGYDLVNDEYIENCLAIGFNFVNRVESKIQSGFKNKFEIVRTYYKIKKYEEMYLKFMMSIPAHCMDDRFPSTFNTFEKAFEKLTI